MLARPGEGAPPPPAGAQLPAMPPPANWGKVESQLGEALKQGNAGAETQARAETEKQTVLADAYENHLQQLRANEQKRVDDTNAAQRNIDRVHPATSRRPRSIRGTSGTARASASKAMAGIGMILSGIGAGLTHGPNLAAQFITKQIDQDIDAQKANLGKKENLLGYFFKKYGTSRTRRSRRAAYLTRRRSPARSDARELEPAASRLSRRRRS
jgi:hypothetical protein